MRPAKPMNNGRAAGGELSPVEMLTLAPAPVLYFYTHGADFFVEIPPRSSPKNRPHNAEAAPILRRDDTLKITRFSAADGSQRVLQTQVLPRQMELESA